MTAGGGSGRRLEQEWQCTGNGQWWPVWLQAAAVTLAQCSGAAEEQLCRLGKARLLENRARLWEGMK